MTAGRRGGLWYWGRRRKASSERTRGDVSGTSPQALLGFNARTAVTRRAKAVGTWRSHDCGDAECTRAPGKGAALPRTSTASHRPAVETIGTAVWTRASFAHDVSILMMTGAGRWRGWHPVSKRWMMRIRLPQHGHGAGSASPASVSLTASGTASYIFGYRFRMIGETGVIAHHTPVRGKITPAASRRRAGERQAPPDSRRKTQQGPRRRLSLSARQRPRAPQLG